jgi:uncharacterized protein (TIGR03435 family)
MNAIQILSSQLLLSQPWVERLGWTLVHFLWQGVLIAAVYAAVRACIARASCPNTRYLLACVALAAMMAAPLLTFGLLGRPDAVAASAHLADRVPAARQPTASTSVPANPVSTPKAAVSVGSAQFLPWVVAIWVVGAMAFSIRLIGGCVVAARIRSTLVHPAPPEWQRTLNRLKARVGVSRPVRLVISALVPAPAVVGWLRPVVLAPIGALAGLPAAQMEALLIHELAHIRRYDYLVNMLQSAVEALLFYHPAVWWISGHMRAERELCCDDVAVSLSGDAFTYALALADLESSRPSHGNAAMAANGGSLADRIARLLGHPRPPSQRLSGPGALASAILLIVAAYAMFAQSAGSPRFAVASVKRGAEFTMDVPMSISARPGGRLTTTNAPLGHLIQRAYGVQPYQVVAGPAWINSDGYNIDAKPETDTDQKQMWLMLQTLLTERFQLQLHRETRELPVFALTATKGGPKLPEPQSGPCNEVMPPRGPSGGRIAPPCGPGILGSGTGLTMEGLNLTMAKFTGFLGTLLGREVVDKTGFTRKFDLHLEFAADDLIAGLPFHGKPEDSAQAADPAARPSIMIAVQEQLGLKLESTKGPVEVLVIDRAERPTAN